MAMRFGIVLGGARSLLHRVTLTSALLLGGACGSPAAAPAGATLVAVDSVVLQESESLYVARPGGLTVGADGQLLVSDQIANRLIRFGPDGTPRMTYGAPGSGPGEFRSIGEAVVAWDDSIAIPDYHSRHISLFRGSTGAYLGERRFVGKLTSGSAAGGTVWLGLLDQSAGKSIAIWHPDTASAGSDPVLHATAVAIPDAYLQVPALNGIYGLVQLAAWGDSALVGFGGSDFVLAVAGNGVVADTTVIPAVRRRGTPPDLLRRLEDPKTSFADQFSAASGLMGLWRLPDGVFVAEHFDAQIDHRSITGRVFISLLTADRTRACVDAEVPVEQDGAPWVALHGDTLFVLNQIVGDGEQPSLRTVIRKYRIDTTSCSWILIRRAE